MNTELFIAIVFIFGQILVMVALIIDRFSYFEQSKSRENKLLEENSRLVRALISKNAQDYVMTASIDRVIDNEKSAPEPDTIPEESLSDDEFFESIGKTLKTDKK